MKNFIYSFFVALCLSMAPAQAATAPIVGTILEVEGLATITSTYTTPQAAQINAPVHPNDIIATGPRARVYIQLIDNTELTLGENGKLTIDEYAFNDQDNAQNHAVYTVLKGAFLYVSGLIAKKENPDVTVNIPMGTIGIRGTKFWGGPMENNYSVIVGEGAVVVETNAGRTTLHKGQGTSLKAKTQAPTPAQTWTPEKIAQATKTVALKAPTIVGERMKQNAERNQLLRSRMRNELEKEAKDKKPEPTEKTPETQGMDDDAAPSAEEKRERLLEMKQEKEERLNEAPEQPKEAPSTIINSAPEETSRAIDTTAKAVTEDNSSPVNVIKAEPLNSSNATGAAIEAVRPVIEDTGTSANRKVNSTIETIKSETPRPPATQE